MRCIICDGIIFGHGHNASPVADGICCDVCQDTKVLPMRLRIAFPEKHSFPNLQVGD